MKKVAAAGLMSLALAGSAAAQEIGARPVDRGTPVVIVGAISSQPRDFGFFHEKKMQVAVGEEKTDHTLHLGNAKFFDASGRELAKSDLLDKWWVRAEGTVMKDPRRINVTRLVVIGKEPTAYRQSSYFRPGHAQGYVVVENVAGAREVLPSTRVFSPGTRVEVLAPISSQPRDAGVGVEEKMQVAIGPDKTDYTLHFDDAQLTGLNGQEAFASGLRDRMWVRAWGRVMEDSRRIQVDRLEVVANDDESYRAGQQFGTGGEFGYIRAAQ